MEQLVTLEEFPYIVNKRIHKSVSYIHLAVEKGRPEIVKILLQNGAMVNLLDNNGNTPAHYVSDVPTLKILIANKARLDVVNKFDLTPMATAAKEQRNSIYQYLRLYNIKTQVKQNPVVTVSKPTIHDRFGKYYRERIREINEMIVAKANFRPDYEDLPELSCEMPPLEELDVPKFEFCGIPFKGWEAPVEATATQQNTTEVETTVSASSSKDGMSRHDETTPVLKVRNLKRLQGEKRISLPLPPGCRYINTEPMELSGSEESDLEREILFDKDRTFAKYTGDDLSEFGDDN
jgi:ankyrin repeat protein